MKIHWEHLFFTWKNNKLNKFLLVIHAQRIENSFQKIQKGTSHYILIVHWSHKIYPLFYTQTKGMTTVFSMSNILNC